MRYCIFADSLAVYIESKADLNLEASVFKEKPWLWNNLIEFTDKYDIDVLDIIEQLAI